MSEMRLQKFLANSGVCSRRKAEELILAGKVKVNGKVVKELGTKVNSDIDEIILENKKIKIFVDYGLKLRYNAILQGYILKGGFSLC